MGSVASWVRLVNRCQAITSFQASVLTQPARLKAACRSFSWAMNTRLTMSPSRPSPSRTRGARFSIMAFSPEAVSLVLGKSADSTVVATRQQENRRSRKIEQGRDGHLPYHAPGVRGSLDFPACAQADRLTVDQFDGIKIEDYVAPDSEK